MPDFRLNSPQAKSILALVRDGDYAHPGEDESILLASQLLHSRDVGCLLDVGCGRGGTADWFQRQGWGDVVGIDLDSASIDYARLRYPNVSFFHVDVAKLSKLERAPFDLIYLLTSFYAFSNQRHALIEMRRMCKTGGQLLIVDYTRPGAGTLPSELGSEIGNPIVIDTIAEDLAESHWKIVQIEDWTLQFQRWYEALLDRFEDRHSEIIQLAGTEWYRYMVDWYGNLHKALVDGRLGGVAMTAAAVNPQV